MNDWLHNSLLSVLVAISALFGGGSVPPADINLGAAPVFTTPQGGTGTSSPSGILYGDETIRLKTVTIGSNLTFSGGTLSATGGASSTLLADSNIFSGNNTFSNTITGAITGNAGSATVLQTSRNINGVAFNGSANITINAASSTLLSDHNTFSGNATTSNFFATLASSTDLYGANLAECSDAGDTLNWNAGRFSCGTDADTTYTAGDALTLTGTDIDFDGGVTPSGDLGGTWASPSVTDDSHAHTGATLSGIDISGDTNLTAGDGITLTDDDLDCDTASGTVFGCLSTTDWTTFNNKAGFAYLFPSDATTTELAFNGGFLSTASSTINARLELPSLSAGGLGVDELGKVYSSATTTAGTGLTHSAGAFNVNTSQNISTLSNLTSNGFVKTSGGTGALSVDTTTYESGLTAGDGLTRTTNDFDCDTASGTVFGCLSSANWTTFNNKIDWGAATSTSANQFVYTNNDGKFVSAASSSFFGYTPLNPTRQLTVAGTANQITSSAGAQDLSADRTWTLSLPSHVIFPSSYQAALGSTTNATSTNLTVTGTASTSKFYADGLVSCNSESMLTWSAGTFGCESDTSGAGGAFPFTPTTAYYGLSANSTSTPIVFTQGIVASSTSYFSNSSSTLATILSTLWVGSPSTKAAATADAETEYGPSSYEWVVGYDLTDDSFAIASGTVLGTNNALTIDKSTLRTTLSALTVTGGTTLATSLTGVLVAASGVVSAGVDGTDYTLVNAVSCTNQVVTALTAAGVGTCSSVASTMFSAVNANTILGNATGASAVPTFFATSTLFTGTAGQYGFFSGTGTLIGTSSIFLATTGLVGVSSTTPMGVFSIEMDARNPSFVVGNQGSTTPSFVIGGVNQNGNIGIGTSSPFASLSIGLGNGSSTKAVLVAEHRPATTTSITIDAQNGNQQNVRLGTSATTITLSNITDGQKLIVITCNPRSTAGAVTWATSPAGLIQWAAGTAPTQTTTANKCDIYSFLGTMGTSTLKYFGAQSANF